MSGKRPPVPDGLAVAGRRLWREILAVYDLSPAELAILAQACRTADLLTRLDAELDGAGLMAEGSAGQPRPHPLLAASATQRRTLDSLLRSLNLPFPDEAEGRRRSPQQVAAAQARWRQARGRG